MNTTWIIENFAKEKSFLELTEAVKKLNYPLVSIDGDYTKDTLKQFKNGCIAPYDPPRNCVLFNGTIKMAKIVQEELNGHCAPILYCDWPKYMCSSYYSHFGPYLFNDKYCLMSLKEIVRQKFDIFGHYGKEGVIFIRPDSGEKTFQAGLVDIIDLSTLYDSNKDVEHDLMLVSTPKNVKWEGRFVVSKYKEIIASSTYRFQGQVSLISSVPVGATKFCNEVLQNVNYIPDSVFCLDLCEDNDGNYWIMELTSFSSAGLYSTNKENIIKRVSEIAWEDFTNEN